ncbi:MULTISPECIES: flavin reductase family protein [unclassified Lentimicrobium]|uniref:flavin reductase family protein n=1 Tax=unclassified Lentimicrobium TaxID=2677434 RepID=UPI0015527FC8|nr:MULTISPECIES: flavin reductase family protein [unclassified Lentimicrobium]NPD47123.1 flavin reductase family protein [Lentimicrobium sp. S6]NPD83764.1 flavin reductase family protein [Lentimicrobium sp. L6]
MMTINPKERSVQEVHHGLLGGIAPRPIAFASTIDRDGNPNLSPFSFFNAFSANPPILIFSPARGGKDNKNKHTFFNIQEVPEVVINMVTFDMAQQMSLASSNYPKGVNEFDKAGFTMQESETIKPFRVKESPIQYECKVQQVIETGTEGGAGNLVICEVTRIHIDENILDYNGHVDPNLADLVGRMGGNYYVRTIGDALFEIPKPLAHIGIGFDLLPSFIRDSRDWSQPEKAQLAGVERLPNKEDLKDENLSEYVNNGLTQKGLNPICYSKDLIANGKVWDALVFLMKQSQ